MKSLHVAALLLILLGAVLVTAPMVVHAQTNSIRIGKLGEIEINQATYLGTTLLQPGHYEVQHTSAGAQHYVVVKRQELIGRRHTVRSTGPEVARVPCQIITLNSPARFSFAYWTKGSDGKPTITEIRIFDEPVGHIIALRPSTGE